MRYIPLMILLLASVGSAQTTQPTTAPSTQPTTQPTTQPAEIKPDRTKPLGMVALFDSTCADMSVEKAMAFYHTKTNAQKRYARAECEYYVAVNKLVRDVEKQFGKEKAETIRELLGDSHDYSDVTVTQEGDAAVFQRPEAIPYPVIRIEGKWYFSMPDWFELVDEDERLGDRLWYEETSDLADDAREQLASGKIKSYEELEALVGEEDDE